MKRLIYLAMLLTSCITVSKVTFPETEHLSVVYEDVVGTKDELYVKANAWMVGSFNNAKSVVQYQDKEAGTIMGKYLMFGGIVATSMYGSTTTSDEVYAIIDIRIKDGKVRLEIKPQSEWNAQKDEWGVTVGYTKERAQQDMRKLSESFHTAMLKSGSDF